MISPKRIADGHGDHYLLRLNQSIANSQQIVYIRPFGEMNLHLNPYSAYNADGISAPQPLDPLVQAGLAPDRDHHQGRQAKQDQRQARQAGPATDLPSASRTETRSTTSRDVPHFLDHPKVAFMWTPQTFGSPNMRGNQPRDYWPAASTSTGSAPTPTRSSPTTPCGSNSASFYRKWNKWPFIDRRVRALGQRHQRPLHPAHLPLGQAAQTGQGDQLLPLQRHRQPFNLSITPAPAARCAICSTTSATPSTPGLAQEPLSR